MAWRNLPHDFPAWQTVYWYFRRFEADGSWEAIKRVLVRETRVAAGQTPEPSAGIMDAQTVRCAPQAGPRSVDAREKTNGRKRHLLTDTMGLLVVLITTGNIQDRDGGKMTLMYARRRFARLRLVWADGGYLGKLVTRVLETLGWTLKIIKRSDRAKGFQVLPHRWVVERSLAWLTRSRRLSRDDEGRRHTSAS